MFTRRRKSRSPYAAASDEERISRYLYLLNTLPASVIESAHASAFRELPAARRRALFEQLRPFMSHQQEHPPRDEAVTLAKLARRVLEGRPAQQWESGASAKATVVDGPTSTESLTDLRGILRSSGVMAVVANQVMLSAAVHSYFTVGAGALTLDGEPDWVGDLVDPGSVFAADGGAGAQGFADGADSMGVGGFGGFDGGV